MGRVEWFQKEWPVLKQAPWTFVGLFALGCVMGWGVSYWGYSSTLSAAQENVKLLQTKVYDLKDQLAAGTAPVSQVAATAVATPTPSTAKGDLSGASFSDAQLASLNTSLKALKGTVEITTGDETPKTMALQIQGAFVSNGWTVKHSARRDTFAYIWIEPSDSATSDYIKGALKDAKIKAQVMNGLRSPESLVFILDTPIDPYDRDQN